MNPLLSAAVGSILRWALALGAGYLVKAGIWTGHDADTYVAAGSLALLGLGWSLWKNYRGRIRLLTALHWADATENDIKAHIAIGGPAPSVATPVNSVPRPEV